MLSGATLMVYRTRYSTATFFRKRLIKVVIPWIFWSLVILGWKVYTHRYVIKKISANSNHEWNGSFNMYSD